MELREMSAVTDAEEVEELLPALERDSESESYFIDCAVQKVSINRHRGSVSRRLLSDSSPAAAANSSPHHSKEGVQWGGVSIINLPAPNFPPSRKREEAVAMENLRKRVPSSQLCKAGLIQKQPVSTVEFSPEQLQALDNRPKLLKKILNRPMSKAHGSNDHVTDWRDSEFITECLCWHNVYRQRHCSPPLTMSPELCEYAQTWANHLAHTNAFFYRNDRTVGQNLYCRPGGGITDDVTGQDVAQYWYSAVKQYDFLNETDVPHTNVNTGHFTQLIWSSSRNFGVGKARSRGGKIIVVANYEPVGNISGRFKRNVRLPIPEGMMNFALPPPPESPRKQEDEEHLSDASIESSGSSNGSASAQ